MVRVRFRVCRWLERDEFLEIVKWAEYMGRNGGCSIFRADVEVKRLEEVIDRIESLGGEIVDDDKELVDRLIDEAHVVHVYKRNGYYVIKSIQFLADYLRVFREQGVVRYLRDERGYLVKPYALIDVLGRLEAEGLKIVDHTGLLRPEELLDVEVNVKLRSYQEEALQKWIDNRYRGVIALPTGAGKTIIALAAIGTLKMPALIVVYTKEQMFEWREKISNFMRLHGVNIGLFYGDEKRVGAITIATYQSAYRNVDMLADKFSLLIVDEAHHLPADKFRIIAERMMAPYRLGLSATPYREDGRHEELFKLVGGIVYYKSLQELMGMGFVASFEIIPVIVELTPRERLEFNKLRREYNSLARGRKVEELVKAAAAGDQQARRALQLLSRMRKLLAMSEVKLAEARRIIEAELSSGSKIIVFTQYVDQAEKIGRSVGAPVITGKTDKHRRKIILELFKKGRYRVLIFTTVGDEGIDVPDANVGIILSGTSSRRQFIQRLGRLLRPQPDKRAKLYYVAVKGTSEEAALRKLMEQVDLYI